MTTQTPATISSTPVWHPTSRRPAAIAPGRADGVPARRWARRPTLVQLTILAAVLFVGIGVLVWQLAGRGAEGAVAGGVVTAGLAVLVGSYASVFVSRDRD